MGRPRRDFNFDIEPSDCFAGQPCHLSVFNERGEKVAAAELRGRRILRLSVPLDPKRVGYLRFSIDELAATEPDWPRAFRLFRPGGCPADKPAGRRQPPDICDGSGLLLGKNWEGLEVLAAETFRWVNTNAELIVGPGPLPVCKIQMWVTPGPGLDGAPADLRVRDEGGAVVASARFNQPGLLTLDLPRAPDRPTVLRLCVEGKGKVVPGDPRTLNFRVSHIRRVFQGGKAAPPGRLLYQPPTE